MRSLLVIGFLALVNLALAQNWSLGKISPWVKPDSIDYSRRITDADVDGGYYYSLIDEQANVDTKEYYSHYVYKIVNNAGVQNASELSFNLNPAFQKLVIHTLNIYRDGKLVNKLGTARFKAIQRETDLDKHMYDNTISVFTALEDVRAGDVVEYSYTLKGDNPIYDNKFYYNFGLYASYPLLKINERVVKNKNTKLRIRYYKEKKEPEITTSGNTEEWIWHFDDMPKYKVDDDIPANYRAFPLIEISEYSDWKEVADWARVVFKANQPIGPAVKQKADEIRKHTSLRKDQLITALRFVQNQIRYYGLEIGINAIKPHAPENTITKRFGDCKDKAMLFCALLHELGIDSCYPVLVHSDKRSEIDKYIASPHIFNHVITCVVLDGTTYYFDPTTSYEGGDFDHTYTNLYGKGLVISPFSDGISDLVASTTMSKTWVTEKYRIMRLSGESELEVETRYYGTHADNERYQFANNSFNDIKDNYVKFYKKRYSGVEILEDPVINDDTITNVITVREKYSIHNIWDTVQDKIQKYSADFGSDLVNDFVFRYGKYDPSRTMPVGIECPLNYIHDIEVDLPDDWSVDSVNDIYNTDFIAYARTVSYADRKMKMHYEFKTLRNISDPSEASAFYNHLKKIKENNWYNISHTGGKSLPTEDSTKTNWLMMVVFLLSIVVGVLLCIILFKFRRPIAPEPLPVPLPKPYGIGGWLVLPMIGLFFGILSILINMIRLDYFSLQTWQNTAVAGGDKYSPFWGPALTIEVMYIGFILVYNIFCLILLFSYDRRFPLYMTIRYIMSFLYFLFSGILLSLVHSAHSSVSARSSYLNMLGVIIGAGIWIPYLWISKRAKNTFRN